MLATVSKLTSDQDSPETMLLLSSSLLRLLQRALVVVQVDLAQGDLLSPTSQAS